MRTFRTVHLSLRRSVCRDDRGGHGWTHVWLIPRPAMCSVSCKLFALKHLILYYRPSPRTVSSCILCSEPTHTHTHINTHTPTLSCILWSEPTHTHTHTHTAFLTDWGKSHSVSYPWISCVMIMYSLKKFFLNWKRKRKKGVGGRRLPSSGGRSNSQLHSGKKTQAEISLTILTWLGIFYHQKGFFLS